MASRSASQPNAARSLALASLGLSACFALLQTGLVGLTHDTNFFMHCALKLWDYGPAAIYDHCRDQNAPFHMLVYSPLAAFSAARHWHPAVVLHAVTGLLCFASIALLNKALRQHGIAEDDRYRWVAVAAFTLTVVSALFGVYADREHLLFVFTIPWMVQMLAGRRPWPYTAWFAAVGFCMKPHDVVLFALMTLAGGPRERTFRQRVFSRSFWIIGLCLLAYAAYVALFIPRYIQEILPAAAIVYPSKYYDIGFKLTRGLLFIALSTGMALVYAPRERRLCWLTFIAATTLMYLLNAGWFYTFYLLIVPVAMSTVTPWLSQEERPAETRQSGKKLAIAIAGILAAFCCIYIQGSIRMTRINRFSTYYAYRNPPLFKALDAAAENRFILLSYSTWASSVEGFAAPPESVFAYDNLWIYPWLYNHPSDIHFPHLLRFFVDPVVSALQENPDAVVIEDISAEPLVAPEGIIGFLNRDDAFRKAFEGYARQRTLDYCSARNAEGCRFAVWKRGQSGKQ